MFRMEYWHTAFSMIYCILFLPAIFNIYCNLNSVTHTHTHFGQINAAVASINNFFR